MRQNCSFFVKSREGMHFMYFKPPSRGEGHSFPLDVRVNVSVFVSSLCVS